MSFIVLLILLKSFVKLIYYTNKERVSLKEKGRDMGRVKKAMLLTIIIPMLFSLIGCNSIFDFDRMWFDNNERDTDIEKMQEDHYINPELQTSEINITLYFKHYLADYLVPEKRETQKGKYSVEYVIVDELLKGPVQFERVPVMPSNVKVLDVSRKGDTVFVNLSEEFSGNVDLTKLPDKEKVPEDKKDEVLAEMKRLSIYSIVNSLTELEGVNRVKILINNRALTYEEMGAEIMAKGLVNVDADTPIMAITRSKDYILSPIKAVEQVFTGLTGEPDWERVDAFLARRNGDSSERMSIEEIKKVYSAYISALEIDKDFVLEEEIKPDGEAFVTVTYAIKFANGKKENRENDFLKIINEEGIWKVILPDFFTNIK